MKWKTDKAIILSELSKAIADIKKNFSFLDIYFDNRSTSLVGMMAAAGHCASEAWDLDDIYYTACIIVLLQHHRFDCTNADSKWRAYKIMRNLGIKIDKRMREDYKRSVHRGLSLCRYRYFKRRFLKSKP